MTNHLEMKHKNGHTINVEIVTSILPNPNGTIREIIGVTRDITDRVQAETRRMEVERRMLLSQKLESLGIMAGGIAHDFNNLLASIMGNIDLARRRLPAAQQESKFLEQALHATRRAAELTRQMLAYSGRGKFAEQEMELNAFINENMSLFQSNIPRNIDFRINLASVPCHISADPGQLQQVVVNLLSNAAESIASGSGSVNICIEKKHYRSDELAGCRIGEKVQPGDFVSLSVSDTGCGMDSNMLDHLFEPFYTTKFTGRGMGMAAVQGIVKGHGGAIFVESKEGAGSNITLLFPAIKKISSVTEEEQTMQSNIGSNIGKGSILVVEDEGMVRKLCCDMIEESGYKTLSAADGQQGIETFVQHADEISCVLLDLSMPLKDGLSVFEAIRQLRPQAKVILSSGYSEEEATQRFAGKGLSGFIQKPYIMDDLVSMLSRVTSESPCIKQ